MSAESRRRARELFESVVELTGTAREEHLVEACGDDTALRDAVERLLRADAAAGDFLEQPLARMPPLGPWDPPERVGAYRLLERIGEGGMGVVHRALRDDGAFHREVAVKLLAHGPLSEQTRRRLRAERQSLASLDHPAIAQIFDGGTTEDGMPYMVMELIDGEPIDRHCERLGLSTRRRIELFREVCAAVQCSHRNLIVHCDLKPSNILVTPEGQPKLLDFGIAKLLDEEVTGAVDFPVATPPHGRSATVGPRPLTPEYASPEQLRGDPLSTVSDVYSLGVLLHKVLTGDPPDPESQTLPPGDLGAIVQKAMEPRAEERYGSVEQLSDDLGRHLDGFPVLARRGGFRYRAWKFLGRHRLPVAASVVGVVALGLFALSMTVLAGRLADERTKLEEVVGFFRQFFERAGPLVDQGRHVTLREAVDQNAAWIEQGLEGRPEVKVEIATVLGDIYRELGRPEEALRWSQQALALHRQLDGETSPEHASGLVRTGAALRELGRFEEAEAMTRQGLRSLEARADEQPAAWVEGLNNLVSLYCFQGRYQDAAEDSATALRLAAELDARAPELAVATANRGLIMRQLGNNDEARRLYARALALYRQNLGEVHPHVATLLLNLALIERDLGDLTVARRTLEEANDQFLQLFGEHHYARVRPLVGLAKLAEQQGQPDDALGIYRESIEVAMASQASPPFVLRPAVDFAKLTLDLGRCAEGVPLLRRVLDHTRPDAGDYPRYAEIETLVGDCAVSGGGSPTGGSAAPLR